MNLDKKLELFEKNNLVLLELLEEWEPKLFALPNNVISLHKNKQGRTIKQILGHMIDSASNNTHRIIHLQYQKSPLVFPDYAHFGNNDRWIAIQNYQSAHWKELVQLWKSTNKHIIHIIRNVNYEKLGNEWIDALGESVSLETMIINYLSHFNLHIGEIEELINSK